MAAFQIHDLVATKLPHNCEAIIKEADSLLQIDTSSKDKLCDQLYHGVFLNQKKQMFWVAAGANAFMLFARGLTITWGNDTNYWKWEAMEVTGNAFVEVAKLLRVCWLEVEGAFNTKNLTPGTFYQVGFLIKLNDGADGWEVPVKFKLDLPNGYTILHEEDFKTKPRDQWIEIVVGEFRTLTGDEEGEMKISLTETSDAYWKKGLVINGVIIKPLN